MARRKVDNRIKILLENGAAQGFRTMYVIVGEKSRDQEWRLSLYPELYKVTSIQVVYLHHMLSKASLKQANVLWCYKKNLTYSSHRKKRMKQLKARQQHGNLDINEDDPFEMFVSMTDIRYCYYKETHKILGNTFKMCVLQDFEALTPNLLCRTIETVEGGGLIILLLETATSLKQMFTLNMDVHSRYRTSAHQNIIPRFNERFILSLSSNPSCIVMDDQLRILPISSLIRNIEPVPFVRSEIQLSPNELELKEMKEATKNTNKMGNLINICKTVDQAKVVKAFIESIEKKTLDATITLTASRGRGKSAAMGLALAGAIAEGYSNMYVTSPSPENLRTLFEFVLKGLDALGYEKHMHYETVCSTDPEHNKAVMRLTVTKKHRQIIQYISPIESDVLDHAELVIIDEAAAIPLPHVKALLGPYLVFLSSTISGYEGTGRSLSLKLIKQLREQSEQGQIERKKCSKRKLLELSLKESIRYKDGDFVEKWLYDLLCLEASVPFINQLASPDKCSLFYVNRDTLFGYHKLSEKFLKRAISLLVSSHYRNTPDDLQIISDAPAHHLFVLLPPTSSDVAIPEIYCVIQIALEGKISKSYFETALQAGNRPAGDLIPWTISNVFLDDDFPKLSGARIVRIATHPDIQGKGYGSRALKLLEDYFKISSSKASIDEVTNIETTGVNIIQDDDVELLNEIIEPQDQPHSLLLSTSERVPEALHYLGVSFGASPSLLTFWKKAGFTAVYISQVSNVLTGEHTCVMIKDLTEDEDAREQSWLCPLWIDHSKRLINLLPGSLRKMDCKFALSLLTNKIYKIKAKAPQFFELNMFITKTDLERLDNYLRNQCDTSLIADLIPKLACLYFCKKIPKCKLKAAESAALVGVGVQRKTPHVVASELGLDKTTLGTLMKNLITEINKHINKIWNNCQDEKPTDNLDLGISEIAANVVSEMQDYQPPNWEEDLERVKQIIDPAQFVIKGSETETQKPSKKKPGLAQQSGIRKKIKR